MRSDTSSNRLTWRLPRDQWIEIAKEYDCPDFLAAMLAVAAWDAESELKNIEGYNHREKSGEEVPIVGQIQIADARTEMARVNLDKVTKKLGALRQSGAATPSRERALLRMKRIVKRRTDDVAYERAELEGLLDKRRELQRRVKLAEREFNLCIRTSTRASGNAVRIVRQLTGRSKSNRLISPVEEWANLGKQWQQEIHIIVQWYNERKTEASALAYRKKVAIAARELIALIEGSIDDSEPPFEVDTISQIYAMSDLKRCMGIDNEAFHSIIASIRNLSHGAREASDQFAKEIQGDFPAGSPWGQWICDMRSWAEEKGFPSKIGQADKPAQFALLLLAVDRSLPPHLRRGIARSTFVSRAHEAVKNDRKSGDTSLEAYRRNPRPKISINPVE